MRIFSILLLLLFQLSVFSQSWKPVNGSKDQRNHYTAFTHATIFKKNGEILTNATLLVYKDKIKAVGTNVTIPKNSVIIDATNKFIYPSFIDLLTQYGISNYKPSNTKRGPQLEAMNEPFYYWNETVKPEVDAARLVGYKESQAKKYRSMGFGSVLTHQMDGIIRGTSALVSLGDSTDWAIIKASAAMHYAFKKGKSKQSYPSSLMGMIALIRQAHYDAEYYTDHLTSFNHNQSLESLRAASDYPKIIEAGNTLSMLRADKIGDEFGFQFILKGNGTEFKRIQEIKVTGADLIVPINFPKPYEVRDPFDAVRLPYEKMKEWELADDNMMMLAEEQINFAITAQGLKKSDDFFENMKSAVDAGLDRSAAIQSLTETPAKMLVVADRMGTLEPSKYANFIITSDSLFTEDCKLYANWVMGKEFAIESEGLISFEGTYSLNIDKNLQYDLVVEQSGKAWKSKVAEKNTDKFSPAKFTAEGNRIIISFTADDVLYRLSGSTSDKQSRIWTGKTILGEKWVDWAAIKKTDEEEPSAKKDSLVADSVMSKPRVLYPNMAFGWDSLPLKSDMIVFKNATVWTNEEEGILRNSDVVVFDGKIQMVGYKLNLDVLFPDRKDQLKEVDASGLHLTSGIIDEHSHIAIERGVNESGQAVTAEVSIADVIDSDDINIYRQLSGGVTASQLLHGSANPIGGQSALIKLRWGQTPENMKIEGADGFIKFALGENVKQSNWGDDNTVRFPQTRMGVEQVFYDAFVRAQEYRDTWKIYNAKSKKDKKNDIPPRYDLELEALAEILDTTRFITCHSYIQSEINMLMHVADSMGFRINTFTHILEGYKVADKMKEHGAAGSTFSDWWAYKYEVNDAIPYNGAILHKQGVLTGFNSDDAEMGRRLNQEAAKAVKYGGVSEEEAWKFVTLNPAKMLHLDDRMGSIKQGKDADLVLWTDHPLSVYAKVETTYIDGIPYYDASRDREMRKKLVNERERLIAEMLKEKKKGKATQEIKEEKQKLYECDTIEW